jgi:hypothetical protein
VFESTTPQNVKHHEVAVFGQLDVLEHIAGKERTEYFGENVPASARCLTSDLTASTRRKGRGPCRAADRTASDTSEPSEGNGVWVIHLRSLSDA